MNVVVKYLLKKAYPAAVPVAIPVTIPTAISVVIISCVLALSACSDVDSEDVDSSDFYAIMPLVSTGNDQTNVRVCLATSSSFSADEIRLSAGDSLSATANGITKVLVGNACYETVFDVDEGGTAFVISLDRSEYDGMPNSTVILPEKLSILMPTENQIFNSGESITVTWSPSVTSEKVTVFYSGNCASVLNDESLYFGRAYTVDDTGIHTVLVNTILNAFGYHSVFDRKVACSSSVSVSRSKTGAVDPNYGEGGIITAIQTRKVGVSLYP